MSTFHYMPLFVVFLVISCGTDSSSSSAAPEPRKSFTQRLNEGNGYQQDASGNWVPKIDKRSSFESQGASPYFTGQYKGKSYKAGSYAKKSWWGNKDYGRQAYAGPTDGSRFQKTSRFDGQGAREGTSDAAIIAGPYQTNRYATSSAYEAGKQPLSKPADAETSSRARVFQQPEIVDWKQQRAITLDQSRGILGR